MLSLSIGGTPLEISQDFSFTMNLKSPFFNDMGSYSYPFKIPNTPNNAFNLGFRHRVENTSDPYPALKGTFKWAKINLFTGSVLLKILSGESFEGTIYEGNGEFNYLAKNKSLQNLDFGKLDFNYWYDMHNYISSCKSKCYPEVPGNFPRILNSVYFDPPTTDTQQMIINNYLLTEITEFTDLGNRSLIIPMLYLRTVLDKIFEYLKFSLDDGFFKQWPQFNKCVIYNSVNCNEGPGGSFNYPPYHIYWNYHLPQCSIIDFLTGIETFLNVRFIINNKTRNVKIVSTDSIIKSPDYADFSNVFISLKTSLEEQVKGISIKMNTDSGDSEMESQVTWDENNAKMIKDSVETVADLPLWPGAEQGELRFVIQKNSYYRLNNQTWGAFSLNDILMASQFIYKQMGQKLETKFSTLSAQRLNAGDEQARNGNKMADWRDITPRLLFCKDLFELGNFLAMQGSVIYDNVSLIYQGEHGLIAHYFQSFFDLKMNSKLVKLTLALDFQTLSSFDFSKKIMVNGVKYLVKSVQVVFKKNEIMPATLECFTTV